MSEIQTVTITLTQQQADTLWGELQDRADGLARWCIEHPESEERYPQFWSSNQRQIADIQELADIVFDTLYDEHGNWR